MTLSLEEQKIEMNEFLLQEEIGIFRDYPNRITEIDYQNVRECLNALREGKKDVTNYQRQLKELGVNL